MVVTGSPLVSWDALEADIRGWCSYIDECRLTGDEFVGRYTRFGSIFDSCACFIEARTQSGASSQIAVPYDRICSSNEFH